MGQVKTKALMLACEVVARPVHFGRGKAKQARLPLLKSATLFSFGVSEEHGATLAFGLVDE